MKCDVAQEQLVLMLYGELDDELAIALEQHVPVCAACTTELQALEQMQRGMAFLPVREPSPNLVAQARMRLDDALDAESPHGFVTRLRANFFRWLGFVQSAPALAVLLLGVGFLSGDFLLRYRLAHTPQRAGGVTLHRPTEGLVSSISSITQSPNSELVQVNYSKVVPETVEGSLDDPGIRQLLLLGMRAGTSESVRTDSVALLANECRSGHACGPTDAGKSVREALLVSLRYDHDAGVRLKALGGLQQYIETDRRVRDAVLEAMLHDKSANVRSNAVSMIGPVQSDSGVRQVLRTVSTHDENPYIRNASFEALQGAADVQ